MSPNETMTDEEVTQIRRQQQAELNERAGEREALEAEYGAVYDTKELQENFEVEGFAAPYCVVRRKSDGARGTLEFQHRPRFYFNFLSDSN